MMSVLLFLQIFSFTSGSPVAEPEADPGIIIQVKQYIGNGFDDEDDLEPTHETESCKKWSYPSTNWAATCNDYCAGNSQSPIDIVFNNAVQQGSAPFVYTNYDQAIPSVNIKNNGHSVTVSWDTTVNTPSISGGGLTGNYTLAQFHFHWGCENARGSEHTFNGLSYAMELHLVHYKASYGSIGEAIKHSDGLAVLGMMFDVGTENPTLKPITGNLSLISEPGTNEDIAFNQKLEDLVPTSPYFRYSGSLTTPPCNEVVVWTVFRQEMQFSQDQLEAFRSLKDHHGVSLCDNYRAVQPLNGRSVHIYNH